MKETRYRWGWVIGLSYGVLLTLLSLIAIGVGHGTALPILVSSAPISTLWLLFDSQPTFLMWLSPLLIWTIVGFLYSHGVRNRLWLGLMMLVHYIGVGSVLLELSRTTDGMNDLGSMSGWCLVYLVGQVLLWLNVTKRLARNRQDA